MRIENLEREYDLQPCHPHSLTRACTAGNAQLRELDTPQHRFQLEHIFVPRPAPIRRIPSEGRPRRNGIRRRSLREQGIELQEYIKE